MPAITTKSIVLSALKYGDTSLIVKCLTLKEGVKSYLIRGVLKSKKGKLKPAYFQPLTQLILTANHNTKGNLNSVKEVQVIHAYQSIPTSIVKQSIILFLSEILASVIQEEEENIPLYNYIETGLIWLDTHDEVSNFHLLFLLNLSRFLGFYPDVSKEALVFNLVEGGDVGFGKESTTISGVKLNAFKRLLGINFDAIHTINFSKQERQMVLQIIIRYFELHLDGFRKPKSLQVLETVFT